MRIRLVAIGLLLLVTAAVTAAMQNGNDLYQQGLARETAGDIKGAVQFFERIVRDFSSNRALTAKALVQLGKWSDLLGQDQARKHYERVVREYADQKEAAAEAQTRLDALAKLVTPGSKPSRRLVAESRTNDGSVARLTRDGQHLLRYNQDQRAFELTEIGTGRVRRLTTEGPNPAEAVVAGTELSTDGRRLAAVVRVLKSGSPGPGALQQIERTELRMFEVGGRGPGRTLTSWDQQALGGSYQPFAWAPGSDRIWLFGVRNDRSAQIASVNMNGKLDVLRTLSWRDTSQLPSLSPDGRFLAYHDAAGQQTPSDLYIIATDGSREQHVEHPSDDSKPMFLPDGSGIVFESNRRGDRDLWFLPVQDGKSGGEARLVWRDVGSFGTVDGFSNTGSLYFRFNGNDWGTYTVKIDLNASAASVGELTRLASLGPANESNSGAVFSPDGRYLAHFRAATRLVLRELATGIEREIPFGAHLGNSATADWCPSGDALFATGYIAGTGTVGFLVNVKDQSVRRVSSLPYSDIPMLCVGDGLEIIYLHTTGNQWVVPGSIIRRSLVSGRERTLYEGAAAPLARSRDGSRLTFVATDPKGSRLRRSLVTMSVEGGAVSSDLMPSAVTSPPQTINSAVWLPGGDRLLINVRDTDASFNWTERLQGSFWLWEIPLTGAAPRKLGMFPLPKVEGSYYGPHYFSMHPDGKLLAFQSHERLVQQTWAIDNLFQYIKAGGGL